MADTIVQVSMDDILNTRQQIMNARSLLNTLEDEMRQDPAFARQYGPQITQAEAKFTDVASEYSALRAFLGLDAVPGLQGLGQIALLGVPITIWIAVTAGLAALIFLLNPLASALKTAQQAKLVQAQTAAAQAQQATNLEQQAQNAYNAGDMQTYQQLMNQAAALNQAAAAPTKQESFTDFLSSNWKTMALVAAGIVAVPYLLKE